jgi:hypothetical protein
MTLDEGVSLSRTPVGGGANCFLWLVDGIRLSLFHPFLVASLHQLQSNEFVAILVAAGFEINCKDPIAFVHQGGYVFFPISIPYSTSLFHLVVPAGCKMNHQLFDSSLWKCLKFHSRIYLSAERSRREQGSWMIQMVEVLHYAFLASSGAGPIKRSNRRRQQRKWHIIYSTSKQEIVQVVMSTIPACHVSVASLLGLACQLVMIQYIIYNSRLRYLETLPGPIP